LFLSLWGRGEITKTQTRTHNIDANKEESKLAEEYLNERLLPYNGKDPVDDELDFNETKDSLTYHSYKKYGHGSQNTFDRVLKMLTCSESPFDREKRNGRMKIFRRQGQ